MTKTHLFLDCDGVLADFDRLARDIFGMPSMDFEAANGAKAFWREIRHYRNDAGQGFFRALPLMPDGQELWDATKHLKPTILTGCPFGDWAPPQKVEWAAEKFGPDAKIITCMAREKITHLEQPGDVLVDDKTKYQHIWEEGGGTFVLHTDTASTLVKLHEIRPEWFTPERLAA